MSITSQPSAETAGSGRRLAARVILAVCAIGVVGWSVYTILSGRPVAEAPVDCTATVSVPIRPDIERQAQLTQLHREIASEANVGRALDRLNTAEKETNRTGSEAFPPRALVRRVQQGLRVLASEPDQPCVVTISLHLTGDDRTLTVPVVHQLATQLADDCRGLLRSPTDPGRVEAESAVAAAHDRLAQATSRCDTFVRTHLAENRRRAEEAVAQAVSSEVETPPPAIFPPRTEVAPPSMRDNPAWTEAKRTLTALEDERSDLLVQRTPLHPLVIDVDARIEQMTHRLGQIPPRIAAEPDALADQTPVVPSLPPEPVVLPPVESHPEPAPPSRLNLAEHTATVAQYKTLWAEVADALEQHSRAIAAGRRVSASRVAKDPVEISMRGPSAPADPPSSPTGFLLAMLAAVLAIVGILSLAPLLRRGDPVFSTLEQAQAQLPIPVIGTVGLHDTWPTLSEAG